MKNNLLNLVLFLLVINGFAQQPNISYTQSLSTFALDVPITPITPSNSGGAVPQSLYGEVTTLAGSGLQGNFNGSATVASFNEPTDVTVDISGNVYVADQFNHKIRKITPSGTVSDFAGSGFQGSINGTGTAAGFDYPSGLAIDASNNIYVADMESSKIRKISPAGIVTTLAGAGIGGNDGPAATARFSNPMDVAVDVSGVVYIVDMDNNKIRKISNDGIVSTVAGTGFFGSSDGPASTASFLSPSGVAVNALANIIYVGDQSNYKIRKIESGLVSTFAGNENYGSNDGLGTAASFDYPCKLIMDTVGNIYVVDSNIHKIRKITNDGYVSTLAGIGVPGAVDGTRDIASFRYPKGVGIDLNGNLYVADSGNNKIRKISTLGYTINPDLPQGLVFNGRTGVISGTPTESSSATNYTITAYNKFGSSSATIIMTTGTLGILNFKNDKMVVYPNPVNSTFNIISNDNTPVYQVNVYDIQGKLILKSIKNETIDISPFESGIYLLKLFTAKGTFNRKLIKD